jgi:serine/threonine-protein kinase SRPK3
VLIQREKDMRQWRWSPDARNLEGKLCSNAAEFYGGPFFDDNGAFEDIISHHFFVDKYIGIFLRQDLLSCSRDWRNEMPTCIPQEDADYFFAFMRRMLCWLPEDRATARELNDDPWFDRVV